MFDFIDNAEPLRQGDVLLVPVTANVTEMKKADGLVLRAGLATGHKHRLDKGQQYSDGTNTFVVLPEVGRLTHEEHYTVEVPAGTYLVPSPQEYNPEGNFDVTD